MIYRIDGCEGLSWNWSYSYERKGEDGLIVV